MPTRREHFKCYSCDNEATVNIVNPDILDEVTHCPFCGAELLTSDEIRDMLGDFDED